MCQEKFIYLPIEKLINFMASSLPRPINIALIILSVLGLLLWTAGTFIGLFFYSGGSYGISIPLALAIGGLMALFLYLTRRYTALSTKGYRAKEAKRYKWLYLALYIVVSVASICFVMHSVAVTTTIKNDCRTAALEDLRGIYNLVDKNAPDGSYPKYVNMQIDRYRQGNGHKNASTLNFECDQLRQRLEEKSGYNNLRDEITEYWQTADYTVRSWDLIFLPSMLNTFHDRQTVWVDSLQTCSAAGDSDIYKSLHTPYIVSYKPQTDLYHKFRSLNISDFSGWSIPIALLLQLLIIGSWLAMLKGGSHRSSGIEDGDGGIWYLSNSWAPTQE